MSQPSPLPLAGLLVVSVEQAVAAPFASRQLADLGARVIKVERPDGGDFARAYDATVNGMSSHFAWLNRGKESITADLKDVDDRELVERLIARADVFIQNLAPGAAERLSLAASQLVERHPRLIACDVSGYGAGGPYGERKAYDLLIQCEAGLVAVTGSEDEPAKAGISIADIAGGMYAYSGILTALYERERTGRGAAIATSLFDGLAEWMGYPALYGRYSGADPRRTGAAHASIVPYGPFAARGGAEVNIGVQNERDWAALCSIVLEQPELAREQRFADNPARLANREALEAAMRARLAELELGELVARLQAAGVAYGVVRAAGELFSHPQVLERDRLRRVDSPVGEVLTLAPAVSVAGRERHEFGAIPALGEHDAAVRRWLAGDG